MRGETLEMSHSLQRHSLLTQRPHFGLFKIFPWKLSQGPAGVSGVNGHAAVKRDEHGGGEWE